LKEAKSNFIPFPYAARQQKNTGERRMYIDTMILIETAECPV
jgi:hypothetical protein